MFKGKASLMVWGVAIIILLAGIASAEPVRIAGVSIGARGNAEVLVIHLGNSSPGGATPVYRDHIFRQAGYGYVEFPDATLTGEEREIKQDGLYLESVRLKTEPASPNPAVRVYFYFKKLAPYTIEQDESEIKFVFAEKKERLSDLPNDPNMFFSFSSGKAEPASAAAHASPERLDQIMDNADSAEKPIMMAQAGQDKPETAAKSFFVPPTAKDTAPKASQAVLPEEDVFSQLVTLRFKDADLQSVIRMIAQKTGLNVIMARNQVSGIITLDLEDVPLGSALDAILKTNDLAFVREPGGIVRIVPRKEIRISAVELKTVHVPINWVPAGKLSETLRPFLSKAEGAQIQPDNDSNAIIITDTPPNVETLLALIDKLDVPDKQVMIEMRLIDMGKNLLRDIGANWSLTQRQKYLLQGTKQTKIGGGQPIIETETVKNPVTGQVEKVIEKITGYTDIEYKNTPVFTTYKQGEHKDKARFVGEYGLVSETPLKEGIDKFASDTGAKEGLGSNYSWGKAVTILGEDFDLDMFLNANQNKNLVKVLANPRIITLNNVKAQIDMVEEYPYVDSVVGSGGSVTAKAEFKETGITLSVTPYITNNGYIRMQIKPEQKIYRGLDQVTGTIPQVDKRSAETNVIIRDEETVLLGGLRMDTKTDVNVGTPWFMDIPIIGWLFKRNSTENRQLETVMFVTPHIIKEPAMSELEKVQYEQIDYGWDLPKEFFQSREDSHQGKKAKKGK